jgi:hypothetical protein
MKTPYAAIAFAVLFMITILCLVSCTYSITMVHTQGEASDVVDETATNTPSTIVTPTFSIPASAL